MLNPKEIVLGLRGYLNEFGPGGEAPLLGKHISEEAAFQCTTCGGCEFQCPVGIQHLPIIIGLRRGAVNTGQVGRRLRHQAVPEPGAQRQRAGLRRRRAAEVHREERAAHLRRHAGVLPVAGLHGRVRSAGPRDRAGAGARAAPCRRHLRRAAQGEVHRRSGAPPGQRSGVLAGGRSQHRNAARRQGGQDGFDLPALRAHHRHGLARVRRRRSRSSITANCWRAWRAELPAAAAGTPARRRWSSTTPATWAAIATSTTSRAR